MPEKYDLQLCMDSFI